MRGLPSCFFLHSSGLWPSCSQATSVEPEPAKIGPHRHSGPDPEGAGEVHRIRVKRTPLLGHDVLDRLSKEIESPAGQSPRTTTFTYQGITDLVVEDLQTKTGTADVKRAYDYDAYGTFNMGAGYAVYCAAGAGEETKPDGVASAEGKGTTVTLTIPRGTK